MDDLPELPFEKVLSYLSLEDRLKAKAVSWRWYHMINSFRVKSLCYSNSPLGFIYGKSRWVSGAFAQNFISSTRFVTFFDTFGPTILSSLKHLRLCYVNLSEGDRAQFARTLNSFAQLEHLDIIRVVLDKWDEFKLNLPMLTSLKLETVRGIKKLTLDARRLREVKIQGCYGLKLEIIRGEAVERLLVDRLEYTDVKKLKNLRYLYADEHREIDSTLLASLQQLKEFHTNYPGNASELFEQKQRSGRADLKIYLEGLRLNGPHDPVMNDLDYSYRYSRESFVRLTKNPSRIADQIPSITVLNCWGIEGVAPGLEVDLLKRYTDLNELVVKRPVQDIQRFLCLLKNSEDIVEVTFLGDQPQDLFDRLPEHCTVQKLVLDRPPSDLSFLFRLKHLIDLNLEWSIDSETVRRAFGELPVLKIFFFRCGDDEKAALIEIEPISKQFQIELGEEDEEVEKKTCSDLNSAIEFIFRNERL